jgi:hypothetical protein
MVSPVERGTIQRGRSSAHPPASGDRSVTIAELAHEDYRAMARDHLAKARVADESAAANDGLAARHDLEGRPAFARKCRDFAIAQRWNAIRHRDAAEVCITAAEAERR